MSGMLTSATLLAPETLIGLVAGLICLFACYAVWSALVVRDPLAARAKALLKRRDEMKRGLAKPSRNRARALLTPGGAVRKVVDRLNLLRSDHAERIQLTLAQAGWRSREGLVLYLFAKLFLPVAGGIIAAAFLLLWPIIDASTETRALTAIAMTAGAAYAPDLLIRNVRTKRKQAMTKGLPDALDLLVICAEAGLSLDAALKRVADEMARAAPEIADEFHLTALELSYLPDRRIALDNLMKRTDLAAIRGVVNTLMQTEKYGTPLAQSLRVLAAEFRNDRMMRAEEKAAKLPATLTVPLILFIMPSLFVVLLGPAVISTIDNLLSL